MATTETMGSIPVQGSDVFADGEVIVFRWYGTRSIGMACIGPGTPLVLIWNILTDHECVGEAVFDIGELATILIVHAIEDAIALIQAIKGTVGAFITE